MLKMQKDIGVPSLVPLHHGLRFLFSHVVARPPGISRFHWSPAITTMMYPLWEIFTPKQDELCTHPWFNFLFQRTL